MCPCPFVECESLIGKKNQISCSIAYLAKKRHCKLLPFFNLYTVQQFHQLFLLSTPRACRDTYLRIRVTVPDFQKKSFTGKRTNIAYMPIRYAQLITIMLRNSGLFDRASWNDGCKHAKRYLTSMSSIHSLNTFPMLVVLYLETHDPTSHSQISLDKYFLYS